MITPSLFDDPEPVQADTYPLPTIMPGDRVVYHPEGPKPWLAAFCNHKWREDGSTVRCEGLCECSFPDWRKK